MKRIILVILTSVFVLLICQSCKNLQGGDKNARQKIKVKTSTVSFAEEQEHIAYSGTAGAYKSMTLSFASAGTINEIFVEEGDFVKKGTLLAEINDVSYMNAYNISLAALKRAEDAFGRIEPMYKKGNIPEIQYIEVQTALKQAISSSELLKKNVEDCHLISPIDGYIGNKSIEAGMNVAPGIHTIELLSLNKIKVKVPIPENEIFKIKRGQKSVVTFTALNNKTYNGVVDEIGVTAHPLSHTYNVSIIIDNNDVIIKPGMVCSVNIILQKKIQELAIPMNAVSVDESGNKFVFVLNKNKTGAEKRIIQTGEIFKSKIEIIEGLNSDEIIVVSGMHKMTESTELEIF